jgi:hypothetical protein
MSFTSIASPDEALPQDLADLVLLAWLHGDPAYDSAGGEERLFAAARALVACAEDER